MTGSGAGLQAALILLGVAAFLTLISTVVSGVVLIRIEGRAKRERERDSTLTVLTGDVRSLREGMSLGAERAFTSLAGRVGVIEDELGEQRERITRLSVEQGATDRALEGHIRAPQQVAHLNGWPPPPQG